jgi:hypothetical protein
MDMVKEGFRGELNLCRRRREIVPAQLKNAMFKDDELHVPLQLSLVTDDMPVVISFFEYYRFLDKFVGVVLRDEIAPLILVRVKMPSVIPLPPSLLDVRIAIFHDLQAESDELSARGTDHLCVDADFKLYPLSIGDNSFTIRWISPKGRRLGEGALEKIRRTIEELPASFEYFTDIPVVEC